jgi:hypothetical protein
MNNKHTSSITVIAVCVASLAGFTGTVAARAVGSTAGANVVGTVSSTGFVQISLGYGTGCGVRSSGSVVCWGDDYYGQADPPGQYSGPHGFPAIRFRQVSVGDEASCGLEMSDKLACWGHNQEHQSMTVPKGKFTDVSAGSVVFSAGEDMPIACGIQSNEIVTCWGDTANLTLPKGKFKQVTTGQGVGVDQEGFACGLKTSGAVVCWGETSGKVPPGAYRSVTAGQGFACGLKVSGTVACWGSGAAIPPNGEANVPSPSGQFKQIGGLCGVESGGSINCWDGQTSVPSGNFIEVSGGYVHFGPNQGNPGSGDQSEYCGLQGSGSVVCWQAFQ